MYLCSPIILYNITDITKIVITLPLPARLIELKAKFVIGIFYQDDYDT